MLREDEYEPVAATQKKKEPPRVPLGAELWKIFRSVPLQVRAKTSADGRTVSPRCDRYNNFNKRKRGTQRTPRTSRTFQPETPCRLDHARDRDRARARGSFSQLTHTRLQA